MKHLKVIILGDSGVGKTSLVCRYLHGVYENSATTVSLYYTKQLIVWSLESINNL